jgi:hypothetical protein
MTVYHKTNLSMRGVFARVKNNFKKTKEKNYLLYFRISPRMPAASSLL